MKRPDQAQLSKLNRREVYLWGFCGVIVVIMFIGILSSAYPDTTLNRPGILNSAINPTELMVAFVCVLILSGVYVAGQRRDLVMARDALYRRLMMEEARAEGLLDQETQTYSPVLIESMLDRLANEASNERPLSLFEIGVMNGTAIERRNGEVALEHLNRALSEILRSSLRGADRICREGRGAFLVLLPNTAPERALIPVGRVMEAIERWNEVTTGLDYKLEVTLASGSTIGDSDPKELLERVRRQRREYENVAVFPSKGRAFRGMPTTSIEFSNVSALTRVDDQAVQNHASQA